MFSGIPLYDAPTFLANKIYAFGKDEVVQISGMDENGEQGNPFNSTWYRINDGYVEGLLADRRRVEARLLGLFNSGAGA